MAARYQQNLVNEAAPGREYPHRCDDPASSGSEFLICQYIPCESISVKYEWLRGSV